MDDDDAEQWSGYNTNLKPATEFAVLARAPLAEDAIYKNVITHGTGGLNVDSCRIPTGGERPNRERSAADTGDIEKYGEYHQGTSRANGITTQGRYPANLLLSHSPDCDSENDGCVEDCPIRMLDAQSGDCPTGDLKEEHWPSTNATVYGEYGNSEGREYRGDSGGASRFFYTSKASSSERSCNGEVENEHVAVKPLDLTEWLVTLVTAPGQRVLDPFAGSGTTIMACRRRGRKGVGIEQGPDHAELARERVAHAFNTETDFEGDVSPQAMNPETENDTSNASDATGTGDNVPTQPDLDAYGTSDDD